MSSPHIPSRMALFTLAILCLVTLGRAQIPYTESWMGNTFLPAAQPGPTFQDDVSGGYMTLCMAPNGQVFTNGTWDEANGIPVRQYYSNGGIGTGTSGNLNNNQGAGFAAACNSTYLYFANANGNNPGTGTEFGIVQCPISNISDHLDFLVVNSTSGSLANLMGLAANNSYVYASDPTNSRILAYNAETMASATNWTIPTCPNCNALAVDGSGNVWVLQIGSGVTPQVSCYNSSGTLQGSTLTFASGDSPTSIAYDSLNNRLLVTDDGPDCNIKCYNLPLTGGSPTPVSALYGAVGGILNTGNGHIKGQVAPLYFNHPLNAIGVDDDGNFTVLYGGPCGLLMENYSASGTQQWVNEAVAGQDNAFPDQGSETDVYTHEQHFIMNYANPPGQDSQWTYSGYTIDKNKYSSSDMRCNCGLGYGSGYAVVRLGGQKFLVVTDDTYQLAFYRFSPYTDGETAIPCAFIAANDITSWTPPNNPDYPTNNSSNPRWIWTDTNGSGLMEAGEFQQPSTNIPGTGTSIFSIDSNGDVWEGAQGNIYHYKFQGLNSVGAPQYSFAAGEFESWTAPAPLGGIGAVFYTPATDTLIAQGWTAEHPWGCGFCGGTVGNGQTLVCYTNWHTTQTQSWLTNLPEVGTSLAQAGQFIFVTSIFIPAEVMLFDKTTGLYAGVMNPAANDVESGLVDLFCGISAYQASNGSYLVIEEDDGEYKFNTFSINANTHIPPLVGITGPADRSPYALNSNIPITATAIASTGSTITGVGLYMDGVYQGAMSAGSGNSYSYTLSNAPLGVHTLTCLATDSQGAATTSLGSTVQVSNNGLIGWWKFDDGSGGYAADSSGFGHTLNLGGGISWTTGKFGDAVDFSGGVASNNSCYITPRTALTVAVWAQSPTSTWNASEGVFFSQTWNYALFPSTSNGTNYITFQLSDVASVTAPLTGINITQWHHYAATYDGTTMKIYVDGTLMNSTAYSMSILPANVDGVWLGEGPWYTYYFPDSALTVNLDSLRLYNCALPATGTVSIQTLAQASTDTGAAPTVSITYPWNNATWAGNITLTVQTNDTDSAISEVAYYANGVLLGTSTSSPFSFTWSNPTPGSYLLTAIAYSNGLSVMSAPVNFTILGTPPSPWSTSDIGSVGYTGNAGESTNGTQYEVTGSGTGFQSGADSFRYLYQQISGNCSIIARVTGVQGTDQAYGQAGIMMRASCTDPEAVSAYIGVSAGYGEFCDFRTSEGAGASCTNIHGGLSPMWVKLVRNGSSFSCYYASDGITWTQLGSTTAITMTDPIYIGLAVSALDNTLNTSTYGPVTIYPCALSGVCAAPTFSPAAGIYTSAQSVTISTATNGATIRYTTDGSTPTETHGTVYSTPLNITTATTLQAIAYESGLQDSLVTSGLYTIECAAPTFSLATGTYSSAQMVTISTTTSGATIRYTTDGSTPSEANGTVYSTPVNISATTILKAIAYETGLTDSAVSYGQYIISSTKLANFFTTSYSGSRNNFTGTVGYAFTPAQNLTVTALGRAVSGTIFNSHKIYIWQASNQSLVASATVTPASPLDTLGYAYVTITPVQLTSGTSYLISSDEVAGGDAWMDLGTLANHNSTATISNGVYGSTGSYPSSSSGTSNQGYVPPTFYIAATCAAPTFSPAAGSYSTAQTVTISTTTYGATISYTTDGSTPTETHGTMIASGGTVPISSTCTLNAIAYESGMTDSTVTSGLYTISVVPTDGLLLWLHADAITGISNGGAVNTWNDSSGNGYNATLAAGTAPLYETNVYNGMPVVRFGGNSLLQVSALPLGPYTIATVFKTSGTTQIVYEHSDDLITNANANFLYTSTNSTVSVKRNSIQTGKDIVESNAASWAANTGIPLLTVDEFGGTDASEQLFLNGSQQWLNENYVGNLNNTTVYTEPFNIGARDYGPGLFFTGDIAEIVVYNHVLSNADATTLTNALMGKYALANAPIASLTAPTNGAQYTAPASITLSTTASVSGGTISKVEFYNGTTLLGTVTSSPYNYTWTNVPAGSYAITAIAYSNNTLPTPTTAANITVLTPCAAPTFNPTAGTFTTSTAVTISSSTGGATIRYTTNGTTPSPTVGTVYSSPVSITATCTLQAIAYETGYANSTVTSGVYTIQCAAPTFSPGAGAYDSTQTVTISTATSGATIRYTTNGTTPSSTVGTVYSTPVSITATCTLQAIAYETGLSNSSVTSGVYTINALPTSGMLLWLNADAITGLSNGGAVTTWNDMSGNGYNAVFTQMGGVGVAPLYETNVYNGMPVVRFAGNSLLQVGALPLGTYTIATVFKTTGNSQIVYEHSDNTITNTSGNFLYTSTQSTICVKRNGAQTGKDILGSGASTWAANCSTPLLTVDEFGGTDASEELFINGAQQSLVENWTGALNTTTAYTEPFNIGMRASYGTGGLQFNGDIAEIVIYSGVLSSQNLTTLTNALMAKYALDTPPTVSITAPTNNSSYTAPASIAITASATAHTGSISKVEFYDGNTLIGTATSSPYTITWSNAENEGGSFALTAKAYDSNGFATVSAPITITVNDTALKAYWKFDEDTGTTANDSSGNSNTGTVSNGSWLPGKINCCLGFNGTSSNVQKTSATGLPAANAAQTESCWMYVSATPSAKATALAVSGSSSGVYIGYNSSTTFGVWTNSGTLLVSTTTLPSVNAWHFITYTLSGSTNTLYIDGTSVNTSTTATNTGAATALTAGMTPGGTNYFSGDLDEVRVYNRALSAAEIAGLAAGKQ